MEDKKKRKLIDTCELMKGKTVLWDPALGFCDCVLVEDIDKASSVDAVPVDEILFHKLTIDESGVPELTLQFGDRTLVLRTEPVDAVEVVHGHWEYPNYVEDGGPDEDGNVQAYCTVCGAGDRHAERMMGKVPYCWKCGAKMDGGAEHDAAESHQIT